MNHLEDVPAEKIELARKIIAKHCQKVSVTENQERINPSNHASNEYPIRITNTARINVVTKVAMVFFSSFGERILKDLMEVCFTMP
jgi:hypothetical protein